MVEMNDDELEFSESEVEDDESDDGEEMDSNEELQNAFASGKLKPGLVVVDKSGKVGGLQEPKKPASINDVQVLQMQLEKIKLPAKFSWIERLDIVNDVAPLAPEIALQLEEHKGKRTREIKLINKQRSSKSNQSTLKSVDEDAVHNDFTREMSFYRQAQQAVLKCLPRLREMRVPTKRPDDYFAEMAKSDTHMQKVAQVLLKKQTATERAEKVRKLREQKKFSKQTQVSVMQERQKAKKEMIDSVKKYRKGQKNNLDFLDDRKAKGGKEKDSGNRKGSGERPPRGEEKTRINHRRLNKNEKYGYGGKKKGSKWNTKESLDTFDDGGSKRSGGGGPKRGGRAGGGRGRGQSMSAGKRPTSGAAKRPGKNSRQRTKARGK